MFQILILTDHSGHSTENSVYPLAGAIEAHPMCQFVDIASRATRENAAFFGGVMDHDISVVQVRPGLTFDSANRDFEQDLVQTNLSDYDVVLLRLPPPTPVEFYDAMVEVFDEHFIINRPSGILKTGSKAYLLNFPDLCPPMTLVTNTAELERVLKQMPVVLKPLQAYGGEGIVRIKDGVVDDGSEESKIEAFIAKWSGSQPFLAMQYLEGVTEGDKRVVVCNGEVLGASLRMPREGHWVCNVSRGGTSVPAEAAPEEKAIAEALWPYMRDAGIFLFGFDTLMGDDGKRVLSEINSTSVGGLPQMQAQSGRPVLKIVADHLMTFIQEQQNDEKYAVN